MNNSISLTGILVITAALVLMPMASYHFGKLTQVEHMKKWDMDRFCNNGFQMACELHPDCTGQALFCLYKFHTKED